MEPAPQVCDATLKSLDGEQLPKWIPSHEAVFYAESAAGLIDSRRYGSPPFPPYPNPQMVFFHETRCFADLGREGRGDTHTTGLFSRMVFR
jgi:hypothetical protein